MINTTNINENHIITTDDESSLVDQNNRICIYNDLVNGMVFTNRDEFELNLENIKHDPESKFSPWGGKRGFLVYLKKYLKKEDKYFLKNKGMVTLKNSRYQEYCDDMVLYVALKHVVNGDPVSVIANTEFGNVDAQIGIFNHSPYSVRSLN